MQLVMCSSTEVRELRIFSIFLALNMFQVSRTHTQMHSVCYSESVGIATEGTSVVQKLEQWLNPL